MDENKVIEVFDYYNNKNEHEKHLKGYMYDSLVYRYKDALYRAYSCEARLDKYGRFLEEAMNRDLMRFIQILDEAIGEHD